MSETWLDKIKKAIDAINDVAINLEDREKLRLSVNRTEDEIVEIEKKQDKKRNHKDRYYLSKYYLATLQIGDATNKIISLLTKKNWNSDFTSNLLNKLDFNYGKNNNKDVWLFNCLYVFIKTLDYYISSGENEEDNNNIQNDAIKLCDELFESSKKYHKIESILIKTKYLSLMGEETSKIIDLYKHAINYGDDLVKSECYYYISQQYKKDNKISKTITNLKKSFKFGRQESALEIAVTYEEDKKLNKSSYYYRKGKNLYKYHLLLARHYNQLFNEDIYSDISSDSFIKSEKHYLEALERADSYDNNIIEVKYLLAELYYSTDDNEYLIKASILYTDLSNDYNHPDSMFTLGLMYKEGEGIDRNNDKAVYWLKRSMNHGISDAKYHLIDIYKRNAQIYKNTFIDTRDSDMKLKAILEYHSASQLTRLSFSNEIKELLET